MVDDASTRADGNRFRAGPCVQLFKLKRLIARGEYGLRQKALMNSISDAEIKKYVRIIDGLSTSGLAHSNQHGQCMKSVVGVLPGYRSMTNNGPSVATVDRFIASYDQFGGGTRGEIIITTLGRAAWPTCTWAFCELWVYRISSIETT